jgi:hypothetical protein
VGRFFGLNVSEKRVQGSKQVISRAWRRFPLCLQVIQERFHQGNIDLFEPQFLRSDSPHITAEPQKQRKYVAVCLNRIWAEIPLCGQVMRQETGHMNGKIGGLHR